MPEQPKQIKLIHRWPIGRGYIEPGPILVLRGDQSNYVTEVAPYWSVTPEQAADRTFFEPTEEPWPQDGGAFLYVNLYNGGVDRHPAFDRKYELHQDMLRIGNCFHPETKLNANGVHIDDALRMMRLALGAEGYAAEDLYWLRSDECSEIPHYENAKALLAKLDAEAKP